jgi:hypothetical protein
MSETEYLKRRLAIAEEGLRRVMMVVMQQLPPYAANNLNDVGRGWDQALDNLDAEANRAAAQGSAVHDRAAQAAAHNTGDTK